MEKETALTLADFIFADEMYRGMGYSRIRRKDKNKHIFRLGLGAPRSLTGSEIGYFYGNNGYESVNWTSFLFDEQKYRNVAEDAFWSIIRQGDELVYSAKPITRKSREDLIKHLRYAWINKWKIDNIPLCPCCDAQMIIFRKFRTRKYMYACKKSEQHPDSKWRFLSWDYGLGDKAKAFLEIRREATARYKERMKTLGKNPTPAAFLRKRWKVTKEGNLIENRFK